VRLQDLVINTNVPDETRRPLIHLSRWRNDIHHHERAEFAFLRLCHDLSNQPVETIGRHVHLLAHIDDRAAVSMNFAQHKLTQKTRSEILDKLPLASQKNSRRTVDNTNMNHHYISLAQVDQLIPLVEYIIDSATSHPTLNNQRRLRSKTLPQPLLEKIRISGLVCDVSLTLACHRKGVGHDDDLHLLCDVVQSRIGCNTPLRVTP